MKIVDWEGGVGLAGGLWWEQTHPLILPLRYLVAEESWFAMAVSGRADSLAVGAKRKNWQLAVLST